MPEPSEKDREVALRVAVELFGTPCPDENPTTVPVYVSTHGAVTEKIAHALSAARAEGTREGREAAADYCLGWAVRGSTHPEATEGTPEWQTPPQTDDEDYSRGWNDAMRHASSKIRALKPQPDAMIAAEEGADGLKPGDVVSFRNELETETE